MDSAENFPGRAKTLLKECDTNFPARKPFSPRHTPSFSSSSSLSSSSSSYFPDDSPLSPATPLRFSGVPFSWEKLPGIPKNIQQIHKKKDSILNRKLLPLPPPATPTSLKKKHSSFQENGIRQKISSSESFRRDPFFAAFVECSKDDGHDDDDRESSSIWNGAKVSRSISDRFGFVNLYNSCRRTCAVSESIIYLPRSTTATRTSYDLINRRQ